MFKALICSPCIELNFSLKSLPIEKFSPLKEFVEKELLELTPWYNWGGFFNKFCAFEAICSVCKISL